MIFFPFVLFLVFLLPTNIPGFIEALLAIPLAVIVVSVLHKNPRAGYLSGHMGLLWVITLFALLIGTIFSRSSSMSVLTLARYAEGCILFVVAPYLIPSRSAFIRRLIAFGVMSCALFITLSVFPSLQRLVPAYNSITAINGHHPVAHTVIALLPFLFTINAPRAQAILRLLIISAAFLLSAARGAWLTATALCCAQGIYHRTQKRKYDFFAGALILISIIIITTWATTLPTGQKEALLSQAPVFGRFAKDANLGLRYEYIRQAASAIRDSPLTGHGPGTFELISRMYQSQAGNFSRHAHSFPLETLAEQGLIGGGIILLLFAYSIAYAATMVHTRAYAPFAWSILTITGYSIFEVNLNSTPQWLLFWMITGMLIQHKGSHTYSLRPALYITVVGLIIFAVFTGMSLLPYQQERADKLLWMKAIHKEPALRYLQRGQNIPASGLRIIQVWHASDPDIRLAMAARYPDLYPTAIILDPKNTHAIHLYLRYLAGTGRTAEFAAFLCDGKPSCPLAASKPFAVFLKEQPYILTILPHLTGNDGYAKFLYLLGVNLYTFTGDSHATVFLWEKARQEAPNWAFYHLEVAGAYHHWLNDDTGAEQALDDCMHHPLARKGCRIIPDVSQLLRPVLYSRDILMIPAIQ